MMQLQATSRIAVVLLATAFLCSCVSTRPSGSPVAPLTSTTIVETTQQLRERRVRFHGMRSLMRVRATTNGKTQSFRAQLAVHDAQRMELIAYTPVGTTAMTMKANGNSITTDPEVAPASFNFLRATGLTPAETGMLLLGIPPRDDVWVEIAPGGISAATAGAIVVRYEPPSFPAKSVVITRGDDRIEIEHLEVVSE
ncbi:MAG TPA: DUF3261 domain-containing protein [Thermoanaerobaculia bacterium]|nr:DUF3261 domain-containing protein [Thermoanaerobaculia bacterium]